MQKTDIELHRLLRTAQAGPWAIIDTEPGRAPDISAACPTDGTYGENLICSMYGGLCTEVDATANLIALAPDMARELLAARKVVADLRARWPEANVLREYDAGETSEAQPEPRKPSFAAAADAIIRREYAPRAVGVTWSGILDVIERARRASEGP